MSNEVTNETHIYHFNTNKKHKHKHHLKASQYIKHDKRYFKLDYNQLQLLDSLLDAGGYNKKYIDKSKNLRFSEHFGLLDFNKTRLEKVIISAKTSREDEDDMEILLPMDLPDIKDYEYMFHTHPPTPFIGARIADGILYEFPSISDIYHFADHFNSGDTQGSLVIAPEGIYLIKAIDGIKKIKYPPSEKIFDKLINGVYKIQKHALKHYDLEYNSTSIDLNFFHSTIARDNTYIKMLNELIEKYWGKQIKIYLKPRTYDEKVNKWIIKSLILPVISYEPK